MSQTDAVMEHLLTGAELTPLEALQKFGCFRLGARIYDLRKEGVDIDSRLVWNGRKHWSVYKLRGVACG